ncbi:acyl-CoA reductase-like NAD-dependent aldehyde dehydrogenase [Roseibium hamelinense]|uniref:Acyl-CoA reductase-like NAD-dependent aldehyde dehydrogenase n=1 Tax=Roseibium hamelinense TaxID=150831 RepID=A0A562SY02_9HYPH|nr:aldehyde dehydrogenase family protein [Roseibium hamelinense]MTI44815.1 aldehyde dehydrogenase family protein [Roseibium hamelinense]TWI85993.1 acyl-CoA reductase-like NAD-dependent aldehyde dehydrogenase [Roseibium hamelinense]
MSDITVVEAGKLNLPETTFTGRHLIGGSWLDSSDSATFERLSPSHGHVVSVSANGGATEVEAAIMSARKAFDEGVWKKMSGKDRSTLLLTVADLISQNRNRIALFETLESGKPITQAKAEIEGAVDIWRYAAALARTLHGDSHNSLGGDMLGMILKEPVGVVSMITPWNFPFLIVSQKLPFALAAGCTAVVKPSELTPSTTVILGELIQAAGFPAGVVNIVLGYGDPVGSSMSTHEAVDMVTFTGSTAVGKKIVEATSASLKKVSLELGGKNPQVIFPDADLDQAADAIVFGVYFNAGECCNSGSRIIAHEDVAELLTEKVVELSRKVPFGDPQDPRTQVGAIISEAHNDKIAGYVKAASDAGADIRLGGQALEVPGLTGRFFMPTVVSSLSADMPIAREEVFGPVLSVLTFTEFDEAVSLANSTSYGLSAGVWSENVHTCLSFAREAQAGTVWTNTWMDGYSEIPFGGVKESGLGRELGRYGIEEFLETKSVLMRIGKTRAAWVQK